MNLRSKIKFISLLFWIFSFNFIFLFYSYANERTISISPKIYEFKGDYNFDNATEVSSIISGRKSMGSFEIHGDMSDDSTQMGGMENFGVEKGNVKFSYKYNGAFLNSNIDSWHLNSDGKKEVKFKNGTDKIEKIKKGALLLKYSFDKENWENAVAPVVNFFEDSPIGRDNLYTTSGEQLAKGCYYRIILLYELSKGYKKWCDVLNIAGVEYRRYAEVYEFYLCNNSGNISIHNLGVNAKDIVTPEYSIEVISAGETLLDGSTTYEGFKIDKLGSTSYKVYVNGIEAKDGDAFNSNGKYEIVTKTQLGKESKQTVYIYRDNNHGLNTYFDNSLVVGKRVFRDGDIPTYDKNTIIKLKSISSDLPYIRGTLINIDTEEIICEINNENREAWYMELDPGMYQADLYNGLIESGSMYHYQFKFNIINELAKPFVNYNNLMKREEIRDFETKHYEVVYQTTRGGYIYVCFPTYDEAFNYAYEIEKRFIEKKPEGVYYRSSANSNTKIKYDSKTVKDQLNITKKINEYARKNVEVAYFNPLESFSYQTYGSKEDLLNNLESLSISESIKVFPSQDVKERMFNKRPYLNNFEMVQVEEYDVKNIELIKKSTGETVNIKFNEKLNNQIQDSGDYIIKECNTYGDVNEYIATYVNCNTTKSIWNFIQEGKNIVSNISLRNDGETFDVDYAIFAEGVNEYDDDTLVKIYAKDVYDRYLTCEVREIKNLCLYIKGNYLVEFIDRNSNKYKININVKGKEFNRIDMNESLTTLPIFYNKIHINDYMEVK